MRVGEPPAPVRTRLHVTAEFVASASGSEGFPRESLREVALVGRSNVGKSTLVNALVGQRLARTSRTPGRTRLAIFYRVRTSAGGLYLVDLPGYGYTGGGATARQAFDALTRAYFSPPAGARSAPALALLLVDARHPGLAADLSARRWLNALSVDTTIVATKIDKLSRAERPRASAELQAAFEAPVVSVSAATGEGLKALWTLILAHARPV